MKKKNTSWKAKPRKKYRTLRKRKPGVREAGVRPGNGFLSGTCFAEKEDNRWLMYLSLRI